MKSYLSKIAIRKALGVYLGEHEIAVCKSASTPLGSVITSSSKEPCTSENMPEVLERILAPYLGKKRHPSVAVGIASSRIFFSTRLISVGTLVTPESVMQKALLSSNIAIDDLTLDMLRGTVSRQPIAHVAACRTKYMSGVVGILSRMGIRPMRAEPAPYALLRLAEANYRGPRRAKAVLRFFLGEHQGLAVLVAGGEPLTWKTFSMTPGMESFAIISTSRVLGTQQKHFGIDVKLDYVMIHGRKDLHEQLEQEGLPSELQTRVLWFEGPALESMAFAQGLAIGGLSPEIKAFDLSKTLKARAPIREIFPWGELGFAAGLIGAMGVVMGMHSMEQKRTYVALKAANSQHVCLESGDVKGLEKEKKDLEEKVKAIRDFVGGRIPWTTFTYDISERMPPKAELTKFMGKCSAGGKGKRSKSGFELGGYAPREADGSIPAAVNEFLTELPKDKVWKQYFSEISTNMTLPLANKIARNDVDFTIKCMPKSPQTAKPVKGKGAKPK